MHSRKCCRRQQLHHVFAALAGEARDMARTTERAYMYSAAGSKLADSVSISDGIDPANRKLHYRYYDILVTLIITETSSTCEGGEGPQREGRDPEESPLRAFHAGEHA